MSIRIAMKEVTKLACAALLASLVVGCGGDTDSTDAQLETPVRAEETLAVAPEPAGSLQASAGELAARPQGYFGKKVVVRGPAAEVYNALLFTLDDDPASPGPDVLVVIPRPASIALPGETVTVEGTVRPYVREDLQRDFDWFDLAPELEVLVLERPVVVAESVRTADGTDVVAELEME